MSVSKFERWSQIKQIWKNLYPLEVVGRCSYTQPRLGGHLIFLMTF